MPAQLSRSKIVSCLSNVERAVIILESLNSERKGIIDVTGLDYKANVDHYRYEETLSAILNIMII